MKNFLSGMRRRLILASVFLILAGIPCFLVCTRLTESEDARFEKFTEKIFQDEIRANTLNLHYTLAYPKNYGIKNYEISLGSMNPENAPQTTASLKSMQKKLSDFSKENLSASNRLLYDILSLEFPTQISLNSLYLLQEPLGPSLGIQAQLPVLLAEYTFRTPADIKDYFSLLSSVPDFFRELASFEQEKSKQGLFMNDSGADRIIEQCTSFAENKEGNYLYSMFHEKAGTLLSRKQITKKQYDSYIEMNQRLMETCVFPSYRLLAEQLSELKNTGKNPNGLAHLPGGRQYYEALVKSSTGDYRSIEKIEQDLSQQLMLDYNRMQTLLKEKPDIAARASSISSVSDYTPKQMLDYLNRIMADDFPAHFPVDYAVKYVPKSMEAFSSPAFYLTPPIDTLSPNTIYINSGSHISRAELFTTLAHEGFPGHLYQTLYFGNLHANPLRELLACTGYVEGWATYVEDLSYGYGSSFLGIEPEVMHFLSLNRSVNLCLYSILDIGIHYKGWTLETVKDTLSVFGITQEDTCRNIFQYIIETPANYLKYYLGYLNFCHLQKIIQKTEGDSFSLKDFHQNLLEIGPAPFPVVKKYLLLRY